ncbi:MAG: KamA family radical SAM protein, partial [Spirochaetales bacterium]|nr:KamA family radical SAM protein [Spirochaetales bacterium]
VLEELCNSLLHHRIKPYYLFQGDKVEGTKHLRCPISKGLKIEEELRCRLSGLAMPQYTIDLPEGGGKVILTKQYIKGFKEGNWLIETPEGELRTYPD